MLDLAATYQRARQLAETAPREPREIERRYLLGLAAMYQRVADDLAPEKPDEIQSAKIPFGPNEGLDSLRFFLANFAVRPIDPLRSPGYL
jgi:hypothetical protein